MHLSHDIHFLLSGRETEGSKHPSCTGLFLSNFNTQYLICYCGTFWGSLPWATILKHHLSYWNCPTICIKKTHVIIHYILSRVTIIFKAKSRKQWGRKPKSAIFLLTLGHRELLTFPSNHSWEDLGNSLKTEVREWTSETQTSRLGGKGMVTWAGQVFYNEGIDVIYLLLSSLPGRVIKTYFPANSAGCVGCLCIPSDFKKTQYSATEFSY